MSVLEFVVPLLNCCSWLPTSLLAKDEHFVSAMNKEIALPISSVEKREEKKKKKNTRKYLHSIIK